MLQFADAETDGCVEARGVGGVSGCLAVMTVEPARKHVCD